MQFVLVDFENVQCKTVAGLQPGACRMIVFLGSKQQKLLVDFVKALQPFGSDVEYVRISGSGPNALDFHIAFHVGRLSSQHPDGQFTIVSRDTGFDPLIQHLAELNIHCTRTETVEPSGSQIAEAKSVASAPVRATLPKKVEPKTSTGTGNDRQVTQGSKPIASGQSTKARVAEVLARLKGLKTNKPVRLATLKSSIKSWFKPELDEKQLNAVIQSLADGKQIDVAGAKVSYSL